MNGKFDPTSSIRCPQTQSYEGCNSMSMSITIEPNDLVVTRRNWAGFGMERAFWSSLQGICKLEDINERKFIALAKGRYPHCSVASAVRLAIAQYYMPSGGLPSAANVALHVLVVDDIAMNREITRSFLVEAGHKITCVEGGAEAVAAVKTMNFDVVLMDVLMPEMDGLEATRRIRALRGARARVPIVALTARAFGSQVAECHKAGMNSHLAKPFGPEGLLAAVQQAGGLAEPLDGRCLVTTTESTAHRATFISRAIVPAGPLPEPTLLDRAVFDRTAVFMPAETVGGYVRAIADKAEALLHGLSDPDPLMNCDQSLADEALSIAGCAGLLGFERLTYLGRRFEHAVESGSAERLAVAKELRSALEATLDVINSRALVSI